MASLDDVVTVQKNGVVAVNALVQALEAFRTIYRSFVGVSSYTGITADALICTGPGRLVTLSVVAAASGGKVYDASTVASASDENAICAIPNAIGAVTINFPFTNGIVVKPAASSVVSLSYSQD